MTALRCPSASGGSSRIARSTGNARAAIQPRGGLRRNPGPRSSPIGPTILRRPSRRTEPPWPARAPETWETSVPPIDRVEFKYTLADGGVAAFRERLEHAQPSERKVFVYDTEDLALKRLDLVLRFRTTEGEKDNSTVKLRPAGIADDGAAWRQFDDVEFEVDVVGAERRISAKIDDKLKAGTGAPSELASLFTADQRAFIEACAPAVDLDTVPMLGPIDARKWDSTGLEDFPSTLDVEEWNVEDELIFLELSFKVGRAAAQHAATEFAALLVWLGLDPEAPQQTKTDQVLRFYAARL